MMHSSFLVVSSVGWRQKFTSYSLCQQRKRAEKQFKRDNAIASREEAKKYHDLVVMRKKEAKKARDEQASKRRSQNSATKSGASATAKTTKK